MAKPPIKNGFAWTKQRIRAAELVAEGRLTYAAIGREVGVARETIWLWRGLPEFQERVKELESENQAEARRVSIANKTRRLLELNDRWEGLLTVIRERAASDEFEGVPGGKTGLLTRSIKQVGSGRDCRTVEEFGIDPVLLRELREIEKQAAIEVGDWEEKGSGDIRVIYDDRPIAETS